ncbi:amidohydrolase family protein [Tistrella bauzanensis]
MAWLAARLGPHRLVWGSDWPHTRHEPWATYGDLLDRVGALTDDRRAMASLYGLDPSSGPASVAPPPTIDHANT